VLLDEPTAALGVAQTAEVLDLIERLRDRGHGIVLISHNLADVKAVADRVVVLRLGRNAGEFVMGYTTQDQIVRAITGSTDRAGRRRRVGLGTAVHRGVRDGLGLPVLGLDPDWERDTWRPPGWDEPEVPDRDA
jgi:D-xylose transport system ATP-binding protein